MLGICKSLPQGVVCSQKHPGAKGQPWGELNITLPPSLIAREWETGGGGKPEKPCGEERAA